MPSSRKRNKGKERKAKKVEAEKVLKNNRWRTWSEGVNVIDGKTIKCLDKQLDTLLNIYDLFVEHGELWRSESYREMAIKVLTCIGTVNLLDELNIIYIQQHHATLLGPQLTGKPFMDSLGIAILIVELEQYDGVDLGRQAAVVKMRNLRRTSSTMRDALKFYFKRTSCSCLKVKHFEARKSITKVGICLGCDKEYERQLLSVCSGCMVTQYCSRDCQVTDWCRHEENCDFFVR